MATKAQEKQAAKDNIEAADGVTPEHELKAALDEPAGSTEFSGASAGIKATGDGPDTATVNETPKATLDAQKAAQDAADEVRDIQYETVKYRGTNVPEFAVSTAYANTPDSGDPESISIAATSNGLVVTTTGRELRFDREHALSLQRALTVAAASL